MKKHLLLIGFSCTGKTTLGKKAFGQAPIDSDREICKWIDSNTQMEKHYEHIYEIFMDGSDKAEARKKAIALIEEAEKALIDGWAKDEEPKVISLGPGFPFRENWGQLRDASFVVLLRRSAEGIYENLIKRRADIFDRCPNAKNYDNWDTGVIVDEQGQTYERDESISKIKRLISEREQYYSDNDEEIFADDQDAAANRLREIAERA